MIIVCWHAPRPVDSRSSHQAEVSCRGFSVYQNKTFARTRKRDAGQIAGVSDLSKIKPNADMLPVSGQLPSRSHSEPAKFLQYPKSL